MNSEINNLKERVTSLEVKLKNLEKNYGGLVNEISAELGKSEVLLKEVVGQEMARVESRLHEVIDEEFARMNRELAKRIEGWPVPATKD